MTSKLTSVALLIPLALTGCGDVQQAAHDMAAEQIAADLIGQSVWTRNMGWTFAGPEEFESMKIVSTNGDNSKTRFVVDMDLVDLYTRDRYTMRAMVEYWHSGDSDDWTFGSVSCINMQSRL